MECEGSGYDKVYEILLSQGKQLPEVDEGSDYLEVTVRKRIFNPRIIDFAAKAIQFISLPKGKRSAWICLPSMKHCLHLSCAGI